MGREGKGRGKKGRKIEKLMSHGFSQQAQSLARYCRHYFI